MVSYPPLMPSAAWVAEWLAALKEGEEETQAIKTANQKAAEEKDFARFRLGDTSGKELLLTAAVEGGGRKLRNISQQPRIMLSDHGEWRRNHLRTMEACWGRKPFFREISAAVSKVYESVELVSLEDFNAAIFRELVAFIKGNLTQEELKGFHTNPVASERGKEIMREIRKGYTIAEALADYGREALLGILAMSRS